MVFSAFTLTNGSQTYRDLLLEVTLHVETYNSVLARKVMGGGGGESPVTLPVFSPAPCGETNIYIFIFTSFLPHSVS